MSGFNSDAEICLEIVKQLGSKDKLFLFDAEEEDEDEECNYGDCKCTDESSVDVTIARIKTAIDFSKRSKAFQLRALVEQWDAVTLMREMY